MFNRSFMLGLAIGKSMGTDTSDATATAGDILVGKTAYIAEGKVTGTYVAPIAGPLPKITLTTVVN